MAFSSDLGCGFITSNSYGNGCRSKQEDAFAMLHHSCFAQKKELLLGLSWLSNQPLRPKSCFPPSLLSLLAITSFGSHFICGRLLELCHYGIVSLCIRQRSCRLASPLSIMDTRHIVYCRCDITRSHDGI